MSKPIIGILGNNIRMSDATFVSIDRSYTNTSCVRAIERNGGVPVILPAPLNPAEMLPALTLCDGLLFPGGWDIDPRLYGEAPHALLESFFPDLDDYWLWAAQVAIQQQIPVLGICRGLQVLNVACKGTLYQDLSQRKEESLLHRQALRRDTPIHRVAVEPGTHLHEILDSDSVRTNSLHHQAIKDLGQGLAVSARAEDGVVEGIETSDGNVVAVQWHPEDHIDNVPCMNNLFRRLCERAARHRRA